MIAGTLTVEDHSIHLWTLPNGLISYTVQVTRNGATSATKSVRSAELIAALYVALNGVGNVDEGMLALAEAAMPRTPNVHGADELSIEDAERAVRQLRWIP